MDDDLCRLPVPNPLIGRYVTTDHMDPTRIGVIVEAVDDDRVVVEWDDYSTVETVDTLTPYILGGFP